MNLEIVNRGIKVKEFAKWKVAFNRKNKIWVVWRKWHIETTAKQFDSWREACDYALMQASLDLRARRLLKWD